MKATLLVLLLNHSPLHSNTVNLMGVKQFLSEYPLGAVVALEGLPTCIHRKALFSGKAFKN